MANNSSVNGTRVTEGTEETFHIYVLSFAYGILAVVIVGHLVWRWQWRRRMLSKTKAHTPGDKSFKHKHLRQKVTEDFAAIQSLSSDARLVNANIQPREFGACKDGSDVPSHWYRMKAFDLAADLVSSQFHLLHEDSRHPPGSLSLPDFLAALQQQGSSISTRPSLIEGCKSLYSLARYKDGKFELKEFEEFQSLIRQLQLFLSTEGAPPPPPSHQFSITSETSHQPLVSTTSWEPLLSSSSGVGTPVVEQEHSFGKPVSRSSSRSKKKGTEIDLFPLVSSLDQSPVTRSSSPPLLVPRVPSPETPV